MSQDRFIHKITIIYRAVVLLFALSFLTIVAFVYYIADPSLSVFRTESKVVNTVVISPTDEIVDGIHVRTGLIDAPGLMLVVNNCTNCHSAKLVTQNRMSKEAWLTTIRWMQETQNLWNLGKNEDSIINYLATNYAPKHKGRRENLTDIEWYELED